MKSFWEKFRSSTKRPINWLEKGRWLILAIVGFSLLWVEYEEFLAFRAFGQGFHYIEVVQYAMLLLTTGVLIELFARSNRAYKQAMKILEYKHRISLELTSNDSWESLLQKITEIPGQFSGVAESCLFMNEPIGTRLEKVGHWSAAGLGSKTDAWDSSLTCEQCLEKLPNRKSASHLCTTEAKDASSNCVYCLQLRSHGFPVAVLKFRMMAGVRLSSDEEKIFVNIADEISVAIQASQDRWRLSEMQTAQVAMAERRTVSTFVHDQLGQNLGYMHLKLDQLSTNESIQKFKGIQTELQRLREVANESYGIVRDILKKIQPETVPHLTNLLREHAKTVAQRAGFTLNFKSIGKPIHIIPDTQQLIFFTFREILNNVEKHAGASNVEVLVIWNYGVLDISVSDNGRGFDSNLVQKEEHFGLEIMRERIENMKGTLAVHSSADSGTVVSISVPVETGKLVIP